MSIPQKQESQDQQKQTKQPEQPKQPKQDATHRAPGISLPKGGGALKSIDEKFSVNPVNGASSLGMALPFSQTRANGPNVSLQYNSGNGNSPFGLGWNLDVSSIQRRTDKALPRYRDTEESDVFLLSGAEDLVPAYRKNPVDANAWEPDTDTVGNITVRRYRPRIEGPFARIEQITVIGQPGCYWKITTRANIVTIYGLSAAARIADPADPARIFKWLPELSYDDKGNCFEYVYKHEDLTNVPDSVEEQHRRNGLAPYANAYLKRIRYGNKTPYYPNSAQPWQPAPPTSPDYFFEAVFDYGEHGEYDEHDDAVPTPAEDAPWHCRTDPFSDYRAGFDIRTWRLCRRILFFHHFVELGTTPCLVQSLDLHYRQEHEANLLENIQRTFYRRHGTGYDRKSQPPLTLDYHPLAWNTTVQSVSPEDVVNAPSGASTGYQFVDLYGEGVFGILTEQANAWYYKSNLGDGHFSRASAIVPKPSLTGLASGTLQIQDLNADGSRQAVVNMPGMAGYFEFGDDDHWQPFRAFKSIVNLPANDPNARFIDLNGDGKADLLITEDAVLRWFPSLGKEGYGATEQALKSFDEKHGPALVFADRSQTIFLADMNGDGLTDIVRVRNANVCYWPNLGYGRFGAKVTMRNAPLFDAPEHFDPAAIRLFDISGTGASDLIYLGNGGCTAWINLSGNAWSEAHVIDAFPGTEMPNKVTVLDLLGNGTGCIVWSSELPAHASAPLRYVDLMGGRKPYVLSGYRNNLGAQTQLEYKSSSYYYLQDKKDGKPWVTRLPFPTMCVSRHLYNDTISGVRFTHLYRYRHGYYDHSEREFRGFGMVEQIDTEDYDRFVPGGGNLTDASVHQAPVRTRSWFHTGASINGIDLLNPFSADYFHNTVVPEHALPSPPIDGASAGSLTLEEHRQAVRACKGILLRQEVYAEDGSLQQALPFSTASHCTSVRLVQPQLNNRHAVFLTYESENVTYHYERNPADPRIEHALNTVVDAIGNVLESASVVYGRIAPDATLPVEVQQEQAQLSVLYRVCGYTNDVRMNHAYRLRQLCETRHYELTGKTPAAADGFFTLDDIRTAFESAIDRRLLESQRNLFASDADPHVPLPLHTQQALGLHYENYALAFTPGLLTSLYGGRVDAAMLAEGYYLAGAACKDDGRFPASDPDDHYWAASGTVRYPANPHQHFYLPERYIDATGTATTVRYYADYHLLPDRVEDALGNQTAVEAFDFRFLKPQRTRDLNDNLSEVALDIFGMVAGTAVLGKGTEADDLTGFVADLTDAQITAFLADPETHGAALLQHATSRFVYSFTAVPPVAASVVRETHHQQAVASGMSSKLQYAFEYSDGGGHVLMKKLQAEPGLAKHCIVHPDGSYTITELDTTPHRRWIGSGRTIRNNKGNPILQYEPYFSTLPAYETAPELVETGVTPILFYDAPGRLIRTRFPDGSFSHIVFDNWKKTTFDQNDNVLASDWYAARIGGALGPAEQDAAQKTALHDNTPSVVHFDTHGRTHYAVAHNRPDAFYATRTEFDIEGHPLVIHDPRGNTVMRYGYDLLGQEAVSVSMDAGTRHTLYDALGKALYGWDAKGNRFHTIYDTLQRPLQHIVLTPAATLRVTERIAYGTDKTLNQNGQIVERHDPAGILHHDAYDFQGNLLQSTRRIAALPSEEIDWTTPATVPLDPRSFVHRTRYDALKRVVESVTPDNSVTRNHYNESNLLSSVEAGLRGGALQTFINRIDHDAKGQRLRIDYGNGVRTTYVYDPFTFRVRHLLTVRIADGTKLQDLRYAYDPVANVTSIEDAAQQTAYFNNAVVPPSGSYTYDAIYRLIAATGREHIGLTAPNAAPDAWDGQRTHLPHKSDGAALQRYLQQYEYDAAGNMTKMRHAAGAGIFTNRWTREFTPAPDSNRLASSRIGGIGAMEETFHYDAHGNLLSMPHLSALEWDIDNHLRSTNLGGGGNAFYQYDSDGHRIRKTVQRLGGLVEERLYLGTLEIFRRSMNGVVTLERESFHVMDGSRRLAIVDTRTAGIDTAPSQLVRYQYGNHLGSASLELDDLGAIIGYEEYYPFGSTSFQSVDSAREVPAKRYRYTGKERDEESGLYYHGARYYIPWLARWSAPDPLGIKDGNNRYVYAGNRPIGSSDPTGMWEMPSWRTVAIVTAVVVVAVVVTVATAGVGAAAVGAAVGAAGLTGTAATAATVAGTVAVGAAAGAAGSWSATATAQGLTGTYNAPGAAEERSAAAGSGAIAGIATAGVGAVLGAVARGGVAGARATQAATTATRAARAAQIGTRAARGAAMGATAGATYEASRQQLSGEREARGGLDWGRIGTSAAIGGATGGVTEAVAGPALTRMGNRLFEGGYGAGLRVGSPEARAAFFDPISRATGMNFVISAPGSSSGRPIIALSTPRGPEAWYVRTGRGGLATGGAQPGDWAPFQGFAEEPGMYVGSGGTIHEGGPGWFVKADSAGMSSSSSGYRLGGEAQIATSRSLGSWRIPVSTEPTPYPQLNVDLRAAGVRVRSTPDVPYR